MFAVALVVHTIVINISDLGVAAALIRDDDEQSRTAAPTVATIAVVTGCVLGPAHGPERRRWPPDLLGSPRAASAIAVMALTLPLAGLSAVPTAFLRRHFRMDRIFVADWPTRVVSGIAGDHAGVAGWGPMALAWSWVAGQLLTTVLLLTYRAGPLLARAGTRPRSGGCSPSGCPWPAPTSSPSRSSTWTTWSWAACWAPPPSASTCWPSTSRVGR